VSQSSRSANRSRNNAESNSRKGNEMSETTSTVVESTLNDKSNSEENSVTESNSNGNAPENTEQQNTEPKTYSPGKMDATFYNAMREQVIDSATKHNALAETIKNSGNRVALKDQLRENPESTNDAEFVALVNKRNELSDALEALDKEFDAKSEPFILTHLKNSGVEAKQAEADELAKQVKATTNYLSAMGASLDDIPNLTNRSGNKSSTGDGRGSGVAKYRNLNVYVDNKRAEQKITKKVKNEDGTETLKAVLVSNLTYGANAANVQPDVFREAFTNAQGTKDAAEFKDRVEFEITDAKNVKHSVVVTKAAE
jgi:hypothetical protein